MTTLISFATSWGPQWGGINAFNTDFLRHLATAYPHELQVVCLVLNAEHTTIAETKRNCGITLVSLDQQDTDAFGPELESLAWDKLQAVQPSINIDQSTVWLGHDRITGAIALKAAQRRSGRSALIHHMSYEHYENYVAGSATADQKVNEQRTLFKAANHCFAIGPLLKAALEDLIDSSAIHELIPGLADIEPRGTPPNRFKIFLSGRLGSDSEKLKQAKLGLASFAHAVKKCDADSAYPDALRSENEPQLRLRGLSWDENVHSKEEFTRSAAEQETRSFVQEHAGRQLSLSLLPFTQDRQALFDELRGCSAALMPSWHEGFGLVAWEAIAAGVPLVLSQKSGVYKLLQAQRLDNLVESINPRGIAAAPHFHGDDKEEVSQALIQIAKDPSKYRKNASYLREALFSANCTWKHCAQQFAQHAGLLHPQEKAEAIAVPAALPQIEHKSGTAHTQASVTESKLLEMPEPRWHAQAGLSLSQLLRAEEALVPFDPARQPFLNKQIEWAEKDKAVLSVRLLVGEGGCGKTRLALQMCQDLTAQGWLAGLLPGQTSQSMQTLALRLLAKANTNQPVLVVVDYAETRQAAVLDLLTYLQNPHLVSADHAPIRVLLLARSGGEWWMQFPNQRQACESLLLAATGPYTLPQLHMTLAEREHAYIEAKSHFANRLQLSDTPLVPDLQADHFANPLPLQMAALLVLHGQTHDTTSALTRALVAHEKRYWTQATAHIPLAIQHPQAASVLMTLVTLAGQVNSTRDISPTWEACAYPKELLRPLWAVLQPLYSGTQGLQGLRPDLLGEALVTQTLLGQDGESVLSALFESKQNEWSNHALAVLARILRTRDDIAQVVQKPLQSHLPHLCNGLCDTLIATHCPPLSTLAIDSFNALTPARKQQVAGVLESRFEEDILPINAWALAVRTHQLQQAQEKLNKERKLSEKATLALAGAFFRHALAQYRIGNTAQAITSGKPGLALNRQLHEKAPNNLNYKSNLAGSLANLSSFLSIGGQNDQALVLSGEALAHLEDLAIQESALFTPDWALGLNNHANRLAAAGQHDQALALSEKALNLRKALAEEHQGRFTPAWATSLNNHANRLAAAGQHDQALALSEQALKLHKELAEEHPARFTPEWATSLNNHANRLAAAGWHDQALALSEQALKLNDELTKQQPARFTRDWAISLNTHAYLYANLGDIEKAIVMTTQCVDLQARLAEQSLASNQTDWIKSSCNLALWQWLGERTNPSNTLPEVDASFCTDRERAEIRFYAAALALLHAVANKTPLTEHATACKLAWAHLDRAQLQSYEDLCLVINAVMHGHAHSPLRQDWDKQLQQYTNQRHGKVPQWVRMCVEKAGATWPN
jgi:glycosyltransferase involved in cell wall biosynthesis